ncbi:MAG: hypothetical protein ACREBQ_02085, partial [Nitrososphaerales archaeon]
MSMPVSKSQTVTVKTKYLWLVFAIFLILLVTAPALYYVNGLAAPVTPTPPPPPVTPPSSSGSTTIATGVGCVSPCDCPNPCTIVIQNSIFGTGALAGRVVVTAGTTVTWSNQDGTQ